MFVDVTMSNVESLTIQRTATGIEARIDYEVKDDQGAIHHTGSTLKVLSGSSVQAMKTWLDAHVIPEINTQEGMS